MTQEINTAVNTEVEWNCKVHPNGNMDADPCPVCGTEGLFNVHFEGSGQILQNVKDDRGSGEYGFDCFGFDTFTRIQCIECETVLYGED